MFNRLYKKSILLLGKVIFFLKKQDYIVGVKNLEEVFKNIDDNCKGNNLNYYLNIGKTNLVDLQIVHPKNFTDRNDYGYAIYISLEKMSREDNILILNLSGSKYFEELSKTDVPEGVLSYYLIREDVLDVSLVLKELLINVWDYAEEQKIYYDLNVF